MPPEHGALGLVFDVAGCWFSVRRGVSRQAGRPMAGLQEVDIPGMPELLFLVPEGAMAAIFCGHRQY